MAGWLAESLADLSVRKNQNNAMLDLAKKVMDL